VLWDFKIIIIYTFLEFIDNKKLELDDNVYIFMSRELHIFKIIIIYVIF
jgi:hypothetical protein